MFLAHLVHFPIFAAKILKFRKKTKTEGLKDEHIQFYRALPATAGGPISR